MKKNFSQILILIFVTTIFSFGQSNSWNGLTPLYSTRVNFEKLLGKSKDEVCNSCIYETAKEKIYASYAEKQCDEGWNVPIKTILSITVYSKTNEGKSPADLNLNKNKFTVVVYDNLSQKWTDAEAGLIYHFQDGIQAQLSSITYIPKRSDNHLRCDGFPLFMPERHYFTMHTVSFYNPELSKKEGLNEIFAHADTFAIDLMNSSPKDEYKGFILVYFDNSLSFKEYKSRLNKLKDFIFKLRKIPTKRITVFEAGMLKESRIEFYILPKELKPPTPNPTLPSPQFMKKATQISLENEDL